MKRFSFLILGCLLLVLAGCGVGGEIIVTGTVEDQQDGVPVQDATILLGEQDAETNEDGEFKFVGIEAGSYNLQVEREGYNTYSETKNIASSQTIDLKIHTHMGITTIPEGFNNYQIAGYVFPNENLPIEKIEGAYLESPLGHEEHFVKRQYHDSGEIFSTDPSSPFNVMDVEEGTWKLIINTTDGESIIREIPVDMSNMPGKANLISPSENETLRSENPEFEFELPEKGLRRAMIHIYKGTGSNRENIVFEEIKLEEKEFSLATNLDPGETYYWRIYSIRSGDLPIRYQALTDSVPFEVGE